MYMSQLIMKKKLDLHSPPTEYVWIFPAPVRMLKMTILADIFHKNVSENQDLQFRLPTNSVNFAFRFTVVESKDFTNVCLS